MPARGHREEVGDTVEPYATLIDPSSESMSYDTTGSTPYLYFTRINDTDPLDFDLVRVPLRLGLES